MTFKFKNRLQNVLEALIIFLLFVGGVSLFVADPVEALVEGPVVAILGSQLAAYFYGITFLALGGLLGYSKVAKKKNLRKYMLFTIYIVLLFTILLEVLLVGWGIEVVDNTLAAVAAGWCWMNWKSRIDYLDPAAFKDDIEHLRRKD